MPPRVLLVAPRTDLPGSDIEVEDILTSGLEVDPLLGEVRPQDVTRKMRYGHYDALLVAGHGSADGVQLTGACLSREALTAAARSARVGVCYLNTCESDAVGRQIAQETSADCICWVGPADDQLAAHCMTLWSAEYARTGDARAAYDAARPGGSSNYLFLSGKPQMHEQDLHTVVVMIERLERTLSQRMDRLEKRVGAVEDKLDCNMATITDLLPPSSPWRLVAWLLGFVFLLVPPTAFYWLHDSVPLPRDVLVWAVLAGQAISVPFFMYGSGIIRESRVKL